MNPNLEHRGSYGSYEIAISNNNEMRDMEMLAVNQEVENINKESPDLSLLENAIGEVLSKSTALAKRRHLWVSAKEITGCSSAAATLFLPLLSWEQY